MTTQEVLPHRPSAVVRRKRRSGPVPRLVADTWLNKLLAAVVIVLIGMRIDLPLGMTVGYLLAGLLIPVWARVLRYYRGAGTLVSLSVLCLISGVWLNGLASATHVVRLGETAGVLVGLAGIICSIGFLLWAREVLPDAWVVMWFAVGLLAGVSTTGTLFFSNPWRFGFSFGVTILVFGIAQWTRNRWLELVAALALTIVAMLTDARSSFALLLLTAILVAWQLRPVSPTRRKSGPTVVLALVALGFLVYRLGEAAIVAGYFGEATRERTVAQLNLSGSLILGGRPELAATVALMERQPWGYGAGVLLNRDDIRAAQTGMAGINYNPNNGYVERYMFGGHIELHSVFGDLWVHFGIPGLILAAAILFILLKSIGTSVAQSTASAVFIFLVVNTIWAIFFGPLYSATRLLILVLALALVRRKEPFEFGRSFDRLLDRTISVRSGN